MSWESVDRKARTTGISPGGSAVKEETQLCFVMSGSVVAA